MNNIDRVYGHEKTQANQHQKITIQKKFGRVSSAIQIDLMNFLRQGEHNHRMSFDTRLANRYY